MKPRERVAQHGRPNHNHAFCGTYVLSTGADQLPVSTRYAQRNDAAVVRNYGALLVEVTMVRGGDGICF